MNNIKLIFLLLLASNFVMGQDTGEELPIEGVEVIKNFDARLKDASKINVKPDIPAINKDIHNYTYHVTTADIDLDYPDPVIRPIGMRKEEMPSDYNGYLKVGVGAPSIKLIDFGYKLMDQEHISLGIGAFHNSASKAEFQKYSDSEFNAIFDYKINEYNALSLEAMYHINDINFYGLRQDSISPIIEDEIDRKYRFFQIEGNFRNSSRDGDSGLSLDVVPYRLSLSDLKSHETGIGVKGYFFRKLNDKIQLQSTLTAALAGYKQNNITRDLGHYSFTPALLIKGEKLNLMLGASLASAEGQYSAFPMVKANFEVVEDKFVFFASATGEYHANSLKNIYSESPFISGIVDTMLYTRELKFSAGLKGQLKLLNYQGEVGFKKTDNHLLYLTDHTDFRNPLMLLYDDINIFYVNGSIEIALKENIVLSGNITQNFYSTSDQEEAWHLPNLELSGGIRYGAFDNKLDLEGNLYFSSSVRYLDSGANSERLNNQVDLNFGASYHLFNRLDLFVQANNVLDSKHQRWNQYPSLGIGIMAGAKLKI